MAGGSGGGGGGGTAAKTTITVTNNTTMPIGIAVDSKKIEQAITDRSPTEFALAGGQMINAGANVVLNVKAGSVTLVIVNSAATGTPPVEEPDFGEVLRPPVKTAKGKNTAVSVIASETEPSGLTVTVSAPQ